MASTDEGLLLAKGSYAIEWNPDEGYSMYTPSEEIANAAGGVPQEALAMLACLVRLQNDPEFAFEMVSWFMKKKQ